MFSTRTYTQTHEFRRGVEHAIIFGLAISPNNLHIASTSDKGTLHIFDLRQRASESPRPQPNPKRRGSNTRPAAVQRTVLSAADFDIVSLPSGSSSPRTAAGYYGPPPDIAHTPPVSGPSVFYTLARFPGMPRAFSDARSMTSTPYHLGADPINWQGQPIYTGVTQPNGQKTKFKNAIPVLPGRPDGKPPKGVVAWDPDAGDRKLWVVGGGLDSRWEVFELADDEGGQTMRVVRTGFRKYLTRQFPEE